MNIIEKSKLPKKFWLALIIFSLVGQIAWVIENMYFNVFIYQEFNASSSDIATMVALSAVTATITTLLMGALSDKLGKRKAFICVGYFLWGISICAFAFINVSSLTSFLTEASAITIGITLVIIFDCVMTFFGSTANDACFNAWITDSTNANNRGSVEGINSTMPLIAILVVFGSFMSLSANGKWDIIFLIIGFLVIISGIIGLFIIEEKETPKNKDNYFRNIFYGFKPKVIKQNNILYLLLLAYAIFGIAIQVFMPYLIIYYQYSLKMSNYVFIMAPAILLASIFTAFYGKIIDKKGFKVSVISSLIILIIGLVFLFLFKSTIMVFIGSLLMMMGYLSSGACFAAIIRNYTPSEQVGLFQGVRMVAYVLIPMVIGPWIGSTIIKGAEKILQDDGRLAEIPNSKIFLGAALITILIFLVFIILFKKLTKKTIQLKSKYYDEATLNPHQEYPRPNLKRDSYYNLNGLWDLTIATSPKIPNTYQTKILVPFPVESLLSQVNTSIKTGEYLIYRKSFVLPNDFVKKQTFLNFGAIDQFVTIYLNDSLLIENQYVGYFPLTVDVSASLKQNNELIVIVKDDNDINYPYGKQVDNSHGMWYTKASGIWQTVWLESVEENYIRNLKITPSLSSSSVKIEIDSKGNEFKIEIKADQKQIYCQTTTKQIIDIDLINPILWSPEYPFLYYLKISTIDDTIESYFAMRELIVLDDKLYLNKKEYFINGILDQGYYSDGLFLPASVNCYIDDITTMKRLGFNTLRKHIKIEPLIWYHLCDKLGMIVWQDFVNNGKYKFFHDTVLPTIGLKKLNDTNMNKGSNQKIFLDSMKKTVNHLYNVPSILLYTIFNEGWGQFNSKKVLTELLKLDNTRIIDVNSGWFDQNISQLSSPHIYFKKIKLKKNSKPIIISEFGGYSYKIPNHSFSLEYNYGYKFFKTREKFEEALIKLYETEILPYKYNELWGCIYTQLSDVEEETNGILTYDRKICKVDIQKINKVMQKLTNHQS